MYQEEQHNEVSSFISICFILLLCRSITSNVFVLNYKFSLNIFVPVRFGTSFYLVPDNSISDSVSSGKNTEMVTRESFHTFPSIFT
jgi:hypothetical protein